MKITALTENTSNDPRIGCEHGLSLYIETAAQKILFDAGQSDLFADNAAALGVDLSQVDCAVLSHGHYDHGGGLRRFLQLNDHAPVYLSRYAFEPHYNGAEKYIGLDPALKDCGRLVFTDHDQPIGKGLTLFSCHERKMRYPLDTGKLLVREDGVLQPEDFRHEQYLLIEESGKKVLVSGCSHKGILNIMHWFNPDVLIGGFHFMKRTLDEALRRDARELAAYPAVYYTCHCTGAEQFRFMQPQIERLHYLSAGQMIEI